MDEIIVDVEEINFEKDVLLFSQQKPVVVDFWAPWCNPCRMLSPILEKLAKEAQGGFRLAKINVDTNPSLSAKFRVQGIPAVKVFQNGAVTKEFTGAQPEPLIRKMFAEIIPSPASDALREATSLLVSRHWNAAEDAARTALRLEPGSGKAALLLAKSLLAQGKGQEALSVLDEFPNSDEAVFVERLTPLANFVAEAQSSGDQPLGDLEAEYLQAARLVSLGNLPAALDGLLDILRKEKRYRNDSARKVFLGILEILGEDDPLTREYRNELASVLF